MRGRRWVAGLSLSLAVLLWAASAFFSGGWLAQLEERSGDLVWRLTADRKDERRLIVVDVDERSLRDVGPWPWPRATQAKLIERIAEEGAHQQILDIVFADPRPDDAVLAKVLASRNAVLAQVFALEQGGSPSGGQLTGALRWPSCPAPFGQATGYLANTEALAHAGLAAGHITPRVSEDGLVRHQPAVICHEGRAYPSLGLAALMQGMSETGLVLQRGHGWWAPAWRLGGASQAMEPVPLDERGDVRVPWRVHPDSLISLSASDVLKGRVPSGLLKNAWVLVGSSAFGLNDSIATPFAGAGAGLQAHAQIVTGLLDGRMPYQPQAAMALQLLAALCGAAVLVGLSAHRWFPAPSVPLLGLGWGCGLWLVHCYALSEHSVWLGWVHPAAFVLALGLALGAIEHAKSRLDRDRLFTHLSSYLPAPVAAALALQKPSSAIEASTRQVSVMFADIRNFSAYCEVRPPEEAAAVLHAFFSVATRVVEQHGGVVESLKGDAVVAVWGAEATQDAPLNQQAKAALDAAVALQQAAKPALPDPAPEGLEPLALGIGLETGPALAGSFGLASRRTHLVMGRTVTVASRLSDMTADLSHPILIGEGMAAQVREVALESMGTFLLDGLKVPHHVYAYPLTDAPKWPAGADRPQ